MNRAGELAIMKQTGHRSLATVRKYIREDSLFRDNATTQGAVAMAGNVLQGMQTEESRGYSFFFFGPQDNAW